MPGRPQQTGPVIFVSPVGTSVLTNVMEPAHRRAVFANANARETDVPPADRDLLRLAVRAARNRLGVADEETAQRMSAELNGLLSWLREAPRDRPSERDEFLLIATDTWLGAEAAKLVAEWLGRTGRRTRVLHIPGLSTASVTEFRSALADLVRMLYEELPAWRTSGYQVVFNLTGGFKGIQGFLQTVATFLADESVYIFQSGEELLRIPALPVRLSTIEVVQDHLDVFRDLERSGAVEVARCLEIPRTLWFQVEGSAALSEWGEVLWREARPAILGAALLPPRTERLRFHPRFERATRDLSFDRRQEVNHAVQLLERFFEGGQSPARLGFKKIVTQRPRPECTHELRAWTDKDAKRIYGHYLAPDGGTKTFQIDLLGDHLPS